MTVDCMACLVALARGLPEGRTFVDERGIKHATLRGQHEYFVTCTVLQDFARPECFLIDWKRSQMVSYDR